MFQVCTLINLMTVGYLSIGTIWDIRFHKIPKWYLLLGTIAAVLVRICMQEAVMAEYAAGAAAGIVFAAVSFITGEKLGYGDSWMIGILGAVCGIWKLMEVLFLAFFCSAVTAGYCVIRKKYKRQTEIPFYPFLLLGFWGGMLL